MTYRSWVSLSDTFVCAWCRLRHTTNYITYSMYYFYIPLFFFHYFGPCFLFKNGACPKFTLPYFNILFRFKGKPGRTGRGRGTYTKSYFVLLKIFNFFLWNWISIWNKHSYVWESPVHKAFWYANVSTVTYATHTYTQFLHSVATYLVLCKNIQGWDKFESLHNVFSLIPSLQYRIQVTSSDIASHLHKSVKLFVFGSWFKITFLVTYS